MDRACNLFYKETSSLENVDKGKCALHVIVPDTVAILSPCAGAVYPKAYQSGMGLVANASASGYKVTFVGVTERQVIHTARNVLAEGFLKTDCEWAFWLDSDMVLEARSITVMMAWAKKLKARLLTGLYFQRLGQHMPLALIRDEVNRKYEDVYSHTAVCPPPGSKTPFKVHAAGFGCILMHRSVLSEMEFPYFKYQYISDVKELSEDFYFCMKAREKKIDLWVIPEITCKHIGEEPLIGMDDYIASSAGKEKMLVHV